MAPVSACTPRAGLLPRPVTQVLLTLLTRECLLVCGGGEEAWEEKRKEEEKEEGEEGKGANTDQAEHLLRPWRGLDLFPVTSGLISSSPLVHSAVDMVASLSSIMHTDASGPLHWLFVLALALILVLSPQMAMQLIPPPP